MTALAIAVGGRTAASESARPSTSPGECSSKVQRPCRTTPTTYECQGPVTCANDPIDQICVRDAAGQTETEKTQKTRDDVPHPGVRPVCPIGSGQVVAAGRDSDMLDHERPKR